MARLTMDLAAELASVLNEVPQAAWSSRCTTLPPRRAGSEMSIHCYNDHFTLPETRFGAVIVLRAGFHRPRRRSQDQAFGGHVWQLCHNGEPALVVRGHDDHVGDPLHDGGQRWMNGLTPCALREGLCS